LNCVNNTDAQAVNDFPRGYPNVAAFLDSDEGFAIYRRFGYLQARLLLNRQEELRSLESKLESLEKSMMDTDEDIMCTRHIFGPDGGKHRELLAEIETKFCSYCEPIQGLYG
jgi:hypothetical protein